MDQVPVQGTRFLKVVVLCIITIISANPSLRGQLASSVAPTGKTADELVADVASVDDDLTAARNAIHEASQKDYVAVLKTGIVSSNYDIRLESVRALSGFPPTQRREALVTALQNETVWRQPHGSGEGAVQWMYLNEFVKMLKSLNVTVTTDDLYLPKVRANAAAQLAATK